MATLPESESSDTEHRSGTAPRLAVSEFLGEHQGASSPFGDVVFPLSVQELEQLGSDSEALTLRTVGE